MQASFLTNFIEIGLKKGAGAFDEYLLWAFNYIAVANISRFSGRYRKKPTYVGNHKPAHFNEVDDWMGRFVSTIQENWYIWTPTELAAYGLWRLNRIHPFIEGNGRAGRAACHDLLCVRSELLLPGRKTSSERIREDRDGYEVALIAADRAWDDGHLNFTRMDDYFASLLQAQLEDDGLPNQGASSV